MPTLPRRAGATRFVQDAPGQRIAAEMTPITGSIVALVTPMHEDGSVDYPGLRRLIDWHIAEGTDCIGVVGTTGESPTVNVEEH